jgi:hypothetical protein
MLCRGSTCAFALAATLTATMGGVQASDLINQGTLIGTANGNGSSSAGFRANRLTIRPSPGVSDNKRH